MLPPHRRRVLALLAADVAGAHRGEDGELERAGGSVGALAKLCHECRDVGVRHRGHVLDRADLAARRKQLVQMAAPPGGIFAVAIAACLGPIEYGLDCGAQATRGCRSAKPERFDSLHDKPGVDCGHRQRRRIRATHTVGGRSRPFCGWRGCAIRRGASPCNRRRPHRRSSSWRLQARWRRAPGGERQADRGPRARARGSSPPMSRAWVTDTPFAKLPSPMNLVLPWIL